MRYERTQATQAPGSRGFRLGRRARWAVPAGAVVAVAAVVAGTTVAGAQAAPSLPGRSAAQLIADVQQSPGPGPFSGTIQLIANLGLPALPGAGDSSSALSLLSGSHSASIWYADPQHVRIAEPVQLGESDLRRDGQQVWLWNSRDQTATHLVLPARQRLAPRVPATTPRPGGTMPTPQQVARQILAAVGPTTTVSVQRNVEVAGQAAYQISLAPKASGSLIGRVAIAIDAAKSFPLRVQVFARGSASPAFQLGFTALSFGRPAASNFSFTPPAGAKVKTIKLPPRAGLMPGVPGPGRQALLRPAPGKRMTIIRTKHGVQVIQGSGKNRKVISLPARDRPVIVKSPDGVVRVRPARDLPGKFVVLSPATGKSVHSERVVIVRPGKGPARNSDWQLQPARRPMSGSLFGKPGMGFAGVAGPGLAGPLAGPFGHPRVLGKGWLSVLVVQPGGPGQVVIGRSAAPGQQAARPGHTATTQVISPNSTISSTSGPTGPAGPGARSVYAPPLLGALLRAATPVHGAWGSGRLLRTSLVSVLITSKGTVLAGAVTPAVLYADAAQVK
jgi:outer membrane lipoprotein-sorting protein